MSEQDGQMAQYSAQLRRDEMGWKAQFDYFVHSDRAAVDIGIGAIKTVVIMNAGALVALMTFVSQEYDKHLSIIPALIYLAKLFTLGLVCGASAFAVAYLYQSGLTGILIGELKAQSKAPTDGTLGRSWLLYLTRSCALIMVSLVLASICLFIFGATRAMDIFAH